MKANLIGWQEQSGSPIPEAIHSLSYLNDKSEKILYFYGPVARANPYQMLMYSAFHQNNIAPAELLPLDKMDLLPQVTNMADYVAFHLHWPNSFLHNATDKKNAISRCGKVLKRLEKISDSGAHIVFTLHNKIPHDAKYLEEEILLQQGIIDCADTIHAMSQASVQSMNEVATIPNDKIVIAEHPTYENVYSSFLSKEECRKSLGIGSEEKVFSLFGAIKPYKGLARIAKYWDAFAESSDTPVRLIIAGAPDSTPEAQDFVSWALSSPTVIIQPKKIPFDQVQLYVNAADFGLVPYTRTLNSGSALLHLTFGNSLVSIDEPSITSGIPKSLITTFSDDDSFVEALRSAKKPASNSDLLNFQNLRSPKVVSNKFAALLRDRIIRHN